jgi:hypothetical protein
LYIEGKMPDLTQLPNDIPRAPWVTYANSGWLDWGDFLGTGTIAPRLKKYRSYEDSCQFVHGLKLERKEDWRLYLQGKFPKLPTLPDDIPASPDKTYRRTEYGNKWTSWGDWLGTGRISNKNKSKQYRSYKEAQAFVVALKLKTAKEWLTYIRGDFSNLPPLPNDIPRKPDEAYTEWIDWPTFLGNEDISKFNCKRPFWSFTTARKLAHKLGLKGLKTQKDWHGYCAGKFKDLPPKPLEIPSNPYKKYKKDWKGYSDWFGIENSSINV